MKYKEIIDLYKQNKLNDEEKTKVEYDIDKHSAISEYLYEIDEIEGFENFDQSGTESHEDTKEISQFNDHDEEVKFMHQIKHSIHMAFFKMGVITGAIVLFIVLGVIYILPKAVDKLYYDPTEIVGTLDNGIETNKISLDFAVFSELYLPGNYRDTIIAQSNGYGKYDISILQKTSFDGRYKDVAGQINKGKLVLYDNSILNGPFRNAFVPNEIGADKHHISPGAAGSREEAIKALDSLNSEDKYIAYITLDKVMNYNDFKKMSVSNDLNPIWCAFCHENSEGYYLYDLIGFINSTSCRSISYDSDKYPYLSQFECAELQDSNGWLDNDIMETRLDSLLKYMDDNKNFLDIMGYSSALDYSDIRESIKEYGINIYGYVVIGQKDEIIRLSKLDSTYYVYTRPYY